MNDTEYQLLKFIDKNRSVSNELEAFSHLKFSLLEGSHALSGLQQKGLILSGLFWNYITPAGKKTLQEEKSNESFEIEILI